MITPQKSRCWSSVCASFSASLFPIEIRETKRQKSSLDEQVRSLEAKLQDDPSRRQLLDLCKERSEILKKEESLLSELKQRKEEGSGSVRKTFAEQRERLIRDLEQIGHEVKELEEKKARAKDITEKHSIRTKEIKAALRDTNDLDETERQVGRVVGFSRNDTFFLYGRRQTSPERRARVMLPRYVPPPVYTRFRMSEYACNYLHLHNSAGLFGYNS